MVEYIVEAISTLEWPANATAITQARQRQACQALGRAERRLGTIHVDTYLVKKAQNNLLDISSD